MSAENERVASHVDAGKSGGVELSGERRRRLSVGSQKFVEANGGMDQACIVFARYEEKKMADAALALREVGTVWAAAYLEEARDLFARMAVRGSVRSDAELLGLQLRREEGARAAVRVARGKKRAKELPKQYDFPFGPGDRGKAVAA